METQTTTPQTPADRAGTVGHETKQAAGDVAQTAGQEAKQVTREAKDQVRQLWGQTRRDLTDQAATQQTRVAGGLRELADQLGSMAGAADQDGMADGLVDDVARRAGDAATWLDQRDPGSLLEEARSFARQRPGTFLAIAAGVGVLAGRLSRSLVDEARDSDDSTSGAARSTGPGSSATPTAAPRRNRLRHHHGWLRHRRASAPPAATRDRHAHGDQPDGIHDRVDAGHARVLLPRRGGGNATVPGDGFPTRSGSTQPIAPDGTPSPIDDEGNLTAEGDDALRGNR